MSRLCDWCGDPLPEGCRRDAKTCSKTCRQRKSRFGVKRAMLEAACHPMRFGYADPPYPGKEHYYPDGVPVDHFELIDRLSCSFPDGWALSTSAEKLPMVLSIIDSGPILNPPLRVCVWVRGLRRVPSYRPLNAWEPLIVYGGRILPLVNAKGEHVPQEVVDVCDYRGRFHTFPNAMVGMKPPQFATWMFRLLGARPGDELVDLYPGSGAIGRAWERYAGGDVQLKLVA